MNEFIETSPSRIRAQEAQDAEREARARYLYECFMAAASVGDMSAKADWAPLTSDWDGNRAIKRVSTVGEAINDVLDYRNGPTTSDVIGLLCRTGHGKSCEFEAYQMLTRLADQFVRHNI